MAKCSSRYKWFFVGSDGARCFDFRSRKHADRHNEKFKRFYEGSNKIKKTIQFKTGVVEREGLP